MKPGQMMIALVCGSALLPSMAQEERRFDRCFEQAANRYGLNKRMLVAIARTESALTPHVIGPRNQNGSYDIGMMQINSSWLPTLAKYGKGSTNFSTLAPTLMWVPGSLLTTSQGTVPPGKRWVHTTQSVPTSNKSMSPRSSKTTSWWAAQVDESQL